MTQADLGLAKFGIIHFLASQFVVIVFLSIVTGIALVTSV
jgi:hypothetical protein